VVCAAFVILGRPLSMRNAASLTAQPDAGFTLPYIRRVIPTTRVIARARVAVSALFFANALTLSAWLPRLAELQADLTMTDFEIGAALAAGAVGGVLAGIFAGPLINRRGSNWVAVIALVALLPVLPLIGLAPGAWIFGIVLLIVGALDAVMDAAMNSHAMRVQHDMHQAGNHRSILNAFHGFWSLGTVAGGMAGVSVLCGALVLATRHWLLPGHDPDTFLASEEDPSRETAPDPGSLTAPGPASADERTAATRVMRQPAIWGLGAFIILAVMIEDIPARWSSIYLTDIGVAAAYVGWGFVAFTAAMTAGRFLGDRIVDALGERRWTRIAMAASSIALGAALVAQSLWLFLIGCAITGFGVATLFPAAMRAAAHLPGIRPATGVATVSWLSRAGFVVAPLAVGAIAEGAGVGWGIGVAVIAALALIPLASMLRSAKSR